MMNSYRRADVYFEERKISTRYKSIIDDASQQIFIRKSERCLNIIIILSINVVERSIADAQVLIFFKLAWRLTKRMKSSQPYQADIWQAICK